MKSWTTLEINTEIRKLNIFPLSVLRAPHRSTREELVRWSTAPEVRNVPVRRSGLSAQLTNGYESIFAFSHWRRTFSWAQISSWCSALLWKHKLFKVFFCAVSNFVPLVLHQGPKCPSGCRIEGLMNKYDHGLLKRIEKIRSLLDENTVKQRSTDSATKQTYDYLKDKLTTDAGKLSSTLN